MAIVAAAFYNDTPLRLYKLSTLPFPHAHSTTPLTGLGRGDNRVLRSVKMIGSVLVPGVVAATDVAARLANAQMDPYIAHSHAFGTDMLGVGFERGEGGEVLAGFGHGLKV